MKIHRRMLLTGGTALAALPCLNGQAMAEGVAKQEMPKEGVILVAMVKAAPEQGEAVKEALESVVEPTRKEAGCLCYNLHQSKADKAQFMFYEQWANQAALDAHGKSPHMQTLHAKLTGKTEKGGGLTFYELLK